MLITDFGTAHSFENIGAEIAEKACLENLDVKYNGRSLLHRGRP